MDTLLVLDGEGKWVTAAQACESCTGDDSASACVVPATLTSVDAIEQIKGSEAVRDDGSINKQFDAVYHDMVVSDVLRDMLLNDDSGVAESVWSASQRDEFLVRLFCHLAIGGELNQYEDHIQPLSDTARAMYKSLLSVRKGANDRVEITSGVLRVTGKDEATPPVWLFPGGSEFHPQSFCYLITDPVRKLVTVLYHKHLRRW